MRPNQWLLDRALYQGAFSNKNLREWEKQYCKDLKKHVLEIHTPLSGLEGALETYKMAVQATKFTYRLSEVWVLPAQKHYQLYMVYIGDTCVEGNYIYHDRKHERAIVPMRKNDPTLLETPTGVLYKERRWSGKL